MLYEQFKIRDISSQICNLNIQKCDLDKIYLQTKKFEYYLY